MAIAYNFNPNLGIIEVKASGHVSIEDRAKFVQLAIQDPELPKRAPVLIDASDVYNTPSVDDVSRMASLLDLLSRRFRERIAYIAIRPGTVVPYSLAALQSYTPYSEVAAFMSRQEALAWLIVEPTGNPPVA